MVNQIVGDLLQDPALFQNGTDDGNQNITVVVSGSRFCIIPSLFRKVERLPWFDILDVPHLNAHPDAFEVLLQYFLFDCLPDMSLLQDHKSELLDLVSVLDDAQELQKHIESGCSSLTSSEKKKQRSIGLSKKKAFFVSTKSGSKRSFFKSAKKEKPFEGVLEDPFPSEMVIPANTSDVPNVVAASTFDSEGSSTITKDDSLKSKKRKISRQTSRRFQGWLADTKKKFPSRRSTHAEWCASEYVL